MIVLICIVACRSEPASSREILEEVLGSDRPAAERYDRCLAITEVGLAEDCIGIVAADEWRQRQPDCASIPASLTQDECWFSAAERAVRGGTTARLWQLCSQAGRFTDKCTSHVSAMQLDEWYRGTLDADRDRESLDALAREWNEVTGREGIGDTVKRLYWNRYHAEHAPFDSVVCEGLADKDHIPCCQGLGDAVRMAHRISLQQDPGAWCGSPEDAASAATLEHLGCDPGLSLDLVIGGSSDDPTTLGQALQAQWNRQCRKPQSP